ncbi:hypothetical protein ACFX19_042849 [Malus domestica]
MLTGLHNVADIHCGDCHEVLGWKYERVYEASHKYKEGKLVLEKNLAFLDNLSLFLAMLLYCVWRELCPDLTTKRTDSVISSGEVKQMLSPSHGERMSPVASHLLHQASFASFFRGHNASSVSKDYVLVE